MTKMRLDDLIKEIKEFRGIKRKKSIGFITNYLNDISNFPLIIASFGEDAAVLDHGKEVILISADGIMEDLIKKDPYWSGYCAILVNIHDICAMGGKPLAMVDILSMHLENTCLEILRGMRDAIAKLKIPVVGGHTHPDTSYNSIVVAIVGIADKDSVIYSHTASPNDDIIVAIDLNGRRYPSCPLCWDTVTQRDNDTLKKQIEVMSVLGKRRLVTAGKDLSNPGILGTTGMLLEVSDMGAIVDLDEIPIPKGFSLEEWLNLYPVGGIGFVVTCKKQNTDEVISLFEETTMSSKKIGNVTKDKKFIVKKGDEEGVLFDFNKEGITKIKSRSKQQYL
ncbi:MAG: methanogenesis marker 2 protein [Candidatus Methanoliparum thermophilum]|uniref:Methanogenesis marker 2 protein n=1 Tax=Methanoliparum thermophilum TaxID=2491083 RepID=A0A520KRW7_METT2|nr:methanogenesis marker 2 protein [Candidatus Methanoliparum sp. LAM-1]RZN64529.1 MAG: methanogenesis marker 2 protein [Candidatus Methanoliparum thermophilum]BDC35873.1 methanogenesis marker 2 protein [Candidatus Methanoliparum sp. LAM-1]